jgi:hypothetical protein
MIGFNAQTLTKDLTIQPLLNSKYSILNDFVPDMLFASSYIITCSLVKNDLSIPDNILYAFTIPPNVGFGDIITANSDLIWSKVRPGTYREIVIQIFDQDFKPLTIIDPNMLIVLSVIRK